MYFNSWQGFHSSAICPHYRLILNPFLPNPHSRCWPPPFGLPAGPHHLHLTLYPISFHQWSRGHLLPFAIQQQHGSARGLALVEARDHPREMGSRAEAVECLGLKTCWEGHPMPCCSHMQNVSTESINFKHLPQNSITFLLPCSFNYFQAPQLHCRHPKRIPIKENCKRKSTLNTI